MTILQHAPTKGNLSAINVRTRDAASQHTPDSHSIGPLDIGIPSATPQQTPDSNSISLPHIPTQDKQGLLDIRTQAARAQHNSLTLDDILEDPDYSDRAKRLAAYLDGRCKADGKWAAWPSVPTIASDLGWDGTEHGGRRRVQRGFEELIAGGALGRMRLGELAAWFEAEGEPRGLAWPKELRRKGRLSAMVCILGWKMPGGACPTSTAECDISVAPGKPPNPPRPPDCDTGVAPTATELSHLTATPVSHPSLNVRSSNPETEERSNVANANDSARAVGAGGPSTNAGRIPAGGDPPATAVEEIPTGEIPPAAVWTDRELAEKFVRRLGNRGLFLKVDHDPEKGGVIRPWRASEHVQVIQPDEIAELLRLRPHVLAFLKGEAGPKPAAIAGPPGRPVAPRPAPKVREPHRVRDLIGRLAGNPDPTVEATACRTIAEALGDHNPESLALFLGLAGDVRRGDLAEGCLQDAFEAACGRKVVNRGRMFTASVKRWKHSARSGANLPPGRSP